jgi:glycosyl hydrolase family 26
MPQIGNDAPGCTQVRSTITMLPWHQRCGNIARICSAVFALMGFGGLYYQLQISEINARQQSARQIYVSSGNGSSAMEYSNHVVYSQDTTTLAWFAWSDTTQRWTASTAPPTVGTTASSRTALLNLFAAIKGNHTISGEFIELGPITPINSIQATTGKCLGMIGGDYYHYNAPYSTAPSFSFNQIAIDYFRAGGIITLFIGFPNPSTLGGAADTGGQLSNVITPGTTPYNNHIATLSKVGIGLKQLDNAGIPVILRLYPEMNGNWFWWGTQAGTSAQFIQLFRLTRDYFVNTVGIKNFLYIYAVNAGGNVPDRYPGDAYVDMTGQDLYTSDPSQGVATYNALLALAPTKPTALAEFGPGGPGLGDASFNEQTLITTIKNSMPNVVFWQQWWAGNGGKLGWDILQTTNPTGALADPWVYNRGDFAAVVTPDPKPVARWRRLPQPGARHGQLQNQRCSVAAHRTTPLTNTVP